ncbi:23S rRNA pseudouridine(1911/1915/1917) synthase RluD [Gilvimarinus sp. F26214L]|uniref:23S rRNA pseudouridine(1911/1915/1917) synthase RluD n=1 Tax=Gilvimarinus sp. DZF01 TaxID=3461371 RepID=UPI004045F92A
MTTTFHSAHVPAELLGSRLDQAATSLFPEYSRGRLQSWIKSGALTVDGSPAKAKQKVAGGEELRLTVEDEPQGEWEAQDLPLDIVHEDEDLLVVNKPAGLVVHPAAGNASGTLLNALLHHLPELVNLPRGGIVHRLDKDTTGLMVVAKTLQSHQSLVAQLQARTVGRQYEAVAWGRLAPMGTVDAPMGRHPQQRKKMAVVRSGGKEAITHYERKQLFCHFSYLHLKLETGRTHQIRVHMAHIGHPLVGDATYGGRRKLPRTVSPPLSEAVAGFERQALHARSLELIHPRTGEKQRWEAPRPDDLNTLLQVIETEDAEVRV